MKDESSARSDRLAKRKLLAESEWNRTYELPNSQLYRESKFLNESLDVSAIDILQRWPSWSDNERLDFANAFWCKPNLGSEDHKIIRFLMKQRNLDVRRAVAVRVPELPSQDEATDLLLDAIQIADHGYANFLQPLLILKEGRALPILEILCKQLKPDFKSSTGENVDRIIDYLWCLAAMGAMGGDDSRRVIRKFLDYPDSAVSSCAERLLRPTD